MSKKQFNQQQKVAIVDNAKEIGVKEASKMAGVHYTTVYEWTLEIEAIGKEAFLAHETNRPVRLGIAHLSRQLSILFMGRRVYWGCVITSILRGFLYHN